MKYKIIYADPPWSHSDKGKAGKRGAGFKYSTMSLERLKAMKPFIDTLADKDCLLAMWWVGPMPQEAIDLVKAWGFKLKTMKGFTWHKKTKHGKDVFAGGSYTRCNSEDCLFAIRGRRWRKSASVRQLQEQERPIIHSAKPSIFRNLLIDLLGDVPRIELFARVAPLGWSAWGKDVDANGRIVSCWQDGDKIQYIVEEGFNA